MAEYDREQHEAAINVINAVYEATKIFEELEHKGKLRGNGHHARQKIAELAAKEIVDRWIYKDAAIERAKQNG